MSPSDLQFAVVCTTIGSGSFLADYARVLHDSAPVSQEQVEFIVIPDRKTPRSLADTVDQWRKLGLRITCPDLDEQSQLVDRWRIGSLIPFDSDNRRNIGYLLALEQDVDVVISIDDDNLPTTDSYFLSHGIVGLGSQPHIEVRSSSGWYNCCDLLATDPSRVYPRGLPYSARTPVEAELSEVVQPIAINAGLWLDDPDVDAITRLAVNPKSLRHEQSAVVLGRDTWCPVNSQNTALAARAVPAYYFCRMGFSIDGWPVDRFGDIFSGLFVQACREAPWRRDPIR